MNVGVTVTGPTEVVGVGTAFPELMKFGMTVCDPPPTPAVGS